MQIVLRKGAYLDLCETFKTESGYGGDAAVDEVDILRESRLLVNRTSASLAIAAEIAYISIELKVFKQIWPTPRSAGTQRKQRPTDLRLR